MHFKQAVLVNTRGLGEPLFDRDFPLGETFLPISELAQKPEKGGFRADEALSSGLEIDLVL